MATPSALETGKPASNASSHPEKPDPQPSALFSKDWTLGPIVSTHGELILLSHCLATGLVDAASFSNWGVFCGMQTGNTVILGLSTATVPTNPHAWLTTLVSIASFLAGAFFTFRLTWALPGGGAPTSSRLYFASILALQAVLILISAALIQADVVPHNAAGVTTAANTTRIIDNVRIVCLLPPLAFQSGMQIAVSRLLGFNELPVNVLTSTYADLMGDKKLFHVRNVKRDRRVAAVVLLLGGAISAGWMMRSPAGMGGVLFLAGGIKAITAVGAFLGMKRDMKV